MDTTKVLTVAKDLTSSNNRGQKLASHNVEQLEDASTSVKLLMMMKRSD
jgi:hypothetical protein